MHRQTPTFSQMHFRFRCYRTPVNGSGILAPGYFYYDAYLIDQGNGGLYVSSENPSPSIYGTLSGVIDDVLALDIPFTASDPTISFYARLYAVAYRSSSVDLSHTATFGISLPEGNTFSSPLTFVLNDATNPSQDVPEPASLALLGVGLVGLAARRKLTR